ncbi:hypothetical protein HBB16_20975 [Pseudonocardia sp. MCCB 268]|nr:hypothetical protein [Pseudonocardia cytotoxica]
MTRFRRRYSPGCSTRPAGSAPSSTFACRPGPARCRAGPRSTSGRSTTRRARVDRVAGVRGVWRCGWPGLPRRRERAPFAREFFVGVPELAAAMTAGIPLYLWLHFGDGW